MTKDKYEDAGGTGDEADAGTSPPRPRRVQIGQSYTITGTQAGPTVIINHPVNGDPNVDISKPADGTTTPNPANATVQSMQYQIDTANPQVIPKDPNTNSFAKWSFNFKATDCPVIGHDYMLSVFAWDKNGNMGIATSSFTRGS